MKSGIVRWTGYVARTGGAHVCMWEIVTDLLTDGYMDIKVEFKEIGCVWNGY
jgi:hypothetical protein